MYYKSWNFWESDSLTTGVTVSATRRSSFPLSASASGIVQDTGSGGELEMSVQTDHELKGRLSNGRGPSKSADKGTIMEAG
jgi:hypothetical protein